MPIIEKSSYNTSPFYLFNSHLQTMVPSVFRKVKGIAYKRERINTPDGDFLDLDFSRVQSKKLVIISHGLEGDSHRGYMQGMTKSFNLAGYDAIAWNYRGCSGALNKSRRLYHSGATDDLDVVVKHALAINRYEEIVMVGFSLGGNLTLKYLGEKNDEINNKIKTSVVFSVPLDLYASSIQLSKPGNILYTKRFLKKLAVKIKNKAAQYPDIKIDKLDKINSLFEFDECYTAPIHGFLGAIDYYTKCSALNNLEQITIPTLIVNAKNDPFLPMECYPTNLLKNHKNVYLEIPKLGGHVGFSNSKDVYWSEKRAVEFAQGEIEK